MATKSLKHITKTLGKTAQIQILLITITIILVKQDYIFQLIGKIIKTVYLVNKLANNLVTFELSP